MKLETSIKILLKYTKEICCHCADPYSQTGTPATRKIYVDKSEILYRYFCDNCDFDSVYGDDSEEFDYSESWLSDYGIVYPFETRIEDLPQAKAIRHLQNYLRKEKVKKKSK